MTIIQVLLWYVVACSIVVAVLSLAGLIHY